MGLYLCGVMRKFNAKNLRREVQKQLKELRGGVGRKAVGKLKIEKVALEREQRLLASFAERSDFNEVNGELKTNSNDYDISIEHKSKNGEALAVSGEGATINDEGLTINDEGKSFNFNLSSFNSSKRPSLPDLEQFVRRDYDLRYNVLTEQTEYRRKDEPQGEYRPVTQRVYRTWLTDLQREGMEFWKIDGLRTAIESMHIADYHPVKHFFGTLPVWDGVDRIGPLMRRLTRDEVMVGYLSRWLLALVAQAQGREEALYANSVAPILISEQQGWHKSTFCRLLLPPELRMFYTDNFNLTAESQCERRLTDCLLINLDEYDRYSARKQSTLKNLMQIPSLRMRKAYARNATTLPRIASFIGTSNTPYLLTDTTGSRRFLCVELTEMIDVDTPSSTNSSMRNVGTCWTVASAITSPPRRSLTSSCATVPTATYRPWRSTAANTSANLARGRHRS